MSQVDINALQKQNAELAKQIQLLKELRQAQKAANKGPKKSKKKEKPVSKSKKRGDAAKSGKKGPAAAGERSKRVSLRIPGEPIKVRSPKSHAEISIGGKKNKVSGMKMILQCERARKLCVV